MITPIGQKIEYDIKTYRNHRKEKPDASTKIKVAAGTLAGTLIPMTFIAKKQNVRLFNIKYGIKEVLLTSAGGIAGGILAGLAADKKEHRKQKLNEGVFQFMNSTVPPLTVVPILALCEKVKTLNNAPSKITGSLIGLLGGMQIAAALTNKINDPYDKVPDRKLTLKDSVANLDDAIGVLVLAKVPGTDKIPIEKTLPAIYSWCGYRAGLSN